MKTDFADSDSYQKVVRFSPDGHEMLTSGNDDTVLKGILLRSAHGVGTSMGVSLVNGKERVKGL